MLRELISYWSDRGWCTGRTATKPNPLTSASSCITQKRHPDVCEEGAVFFCDGVVFVTCARTPLKRQPLRSKQNVVTRSIRHTQLPFSQPGEPAQIPIRKRPNQPMWCAATPRRPTPPYTTPAAPEETWSSWPNILLRCSSRAVHQK